MLIKFVTSYANARQSYRKGREYDVEDVEARQLIAGNVATPVEQEPPPAVVADDTLTPAVSIEPVKPKRARKAKGNK